MWNQVKPITLKFKQINEDGTYFWLEFFSYDYELVKISEAYHYSKNNKLIGKYDRRLLGDKKFNLHYFISKFTKKTSQRLVEYFENPNLFIEYIL
tara:strand:+ start:908 stop:1192 length:285 start_codon:yes stop_codon:yes gene_type:complete